MAAWAGRQDTHFHFLALRSVQEEMRIRKNKKFQNLEFPDQTNDKYKSTEEPADPMAITPPPPRPPIHTTIYIRSLSRGP